MVALYVRENTDSHLSVEALVSASRSRVLRRLEVAGLSEHLLLSVVHQYLTSRRQLHELRPATLKLHRYILEELAYAVGPEMAASRLTLRHIEGWLSGQTCGTSTLYNRVSTVRAFTAWCVAHKIMRTNPAATLKGPKRPKGEPRSMQPNAVGILLSHADRRLTVAILLGIQEGLRIGEVARLAVEDIDDTQRLLRVLGKGGKVRFVPLSIETYDAIDGYLTASPASIGLPLLRSYHDPQRGISSNYLGTLISQLMREAGLKRRPYDGRSAHALRHSCANDMLDQGADLRDVKEMLGHDQLSTTADIYGRRHLATHRLREAAAGRQYGQSTEGR